MNSKIRWFFSLLASCLMAGAGLRAAPVFNVKDYGATGNKADDARPSIQKTIDACAAGGGGIVRLPRGQYTSGTLHLRSHVRFEIDAGATLFASPDTNAYDCGSVPSKAALLFGDELTDVSIGGRGTIDGQAEYEWRPDDFETTFEHKTLMQKMGKTIMRSFPKGHPQREIYPHLLWLGHSKDVLVNGLNWLHCPNWTVALYACERAEFRDLYMYTSLKEAVWADGIDLDSCKDVDITHCHMETGDDCVALVSQNTWGTPLPCENINISHCLFSSASAGIKFSEGNRAGVRNIHVWDTSFNNVNRGVVISTIMGGDISDVTFENLTMVCNRFEWFWAGDAQPFRFRVQRESEWNQVPRPAGEPPPGVVRRITIRNVTAHAKGSTLIHGHTESWLDGITIENFKLFMSTDPSSPYDRAENALDFRLAKNVKLKNVEVVWNKPSLEAWKSALAFENVTGLDVDGFTGRGAWPRPDAPAILLNQVTDAIIHHCTAARGTDIFLKISGKDNSSIRVEGNDVRRATVPDLIESGGPVKEEK